MESYTDRGTALRSAAKTLVLEFMATRSECRPSGRGMKQAEIFRQCGFDWGEYPKATSSNQQYWIVALLRELESEGKVEQVTASGPWRCADRT
jgi:hypothetical protein